MEWLEDFDPAEMSIEDFLEIDYDRDRRIDETALDVEWLEHGDVAGKYVKYVTYCDAEVRRLEQRKKTVRSDAILVANKTPLKCVGKEKPNAADIEAYYRSRPEYQDVIAELDEAITRKMYADLAKNEICFTRKTALENLVRLHGQSYFAGPRVPRDLAEEREKYNERIREEVNAGVANAIKRRRKTNHGQDK